MGSDGVISQVSYQPDRCDTREKEMCSISERQIGLTTNHDRHLAHANDLLPLVLKTNHFRDIRVNDGLSSY